MDRQKHTFHRTNTLHPGPITQAKIIIVADETAFMQTLAVLPPASIIFGIKHFDTEARASLSSSAQPKFSYKF